MTSNWFGEFGRNYIMAFQETGACSKTPYKCLNIISTELYNSLLEKSKCCDHDDVGNCPTANASANSLHPYPLSPRANAELPDPTTCIGLPN